MMAQQSEHMRMGDGLVDFVEIHWNGTDTVSRSDNPSAAPSFGNLPKYDNFD